MFNIGDKVLVHRGDSLQSGYLDGQVGTIIEIGEDYLCLDIEKEGRGGLWKKECELIGKNYFLEQFIG